MYMTCPRCQQIHQTEQTTAGLATCVRCGEHWEVASEPGKNPPESVERCPDPPPAPPEPSGHHDAIDKQMAVLIASQAVLGETVKELHRTLVKRVEDLEAQVRCQRSMIAALVCPTT